ncbi:MAG: extracellular solute-binding protein [Bacillota bacterium]|nr:extracellular solute-binding protein [Bacillota bacterium]
MKKTSLRSLSVLLCLGILLLAITGCTTGVTTTGTTTGTTKATTTAQTTQTTGTTKPAEPVTISAWCRFTPNAAATGIQTYSDQLVWKEIKDRLNIDVQWEHPGDTDYNAALGLLMASGDLPDFIGIISPTLAAQYGTQGALISLQDLIADECPELTQLMTDMPKVKGETTSPDGNIYFFPRILKDPEVKNWPGWIIRGDWLEEINMDAPDKIEDVIPVLTALKEKDQARYPYFGTPLYMIWWYGIGGKFGNNSTYFVVENNNLVFGPLDDRYKEAVTFIHELFEKGLIHPDYLTNNTAKNDELMMQGISGLTYGSHVGALVKYNNMLEAGDLNPGWIPMYPPQNSAGERMSLGRHNDIDPSCGAAITVSSKYATEIAQMMNYFYSKEGQMLLYFGVEGDTYVADPGNPLEYKYTDKCFENKAIDLATYLNNFVGHISTFPSAIPKFHQLNLYTRPEALQANAMAVETMSDKKFPNVPLLPEELKRIQEIDRDMATFIEENTHGFIMGNLSIDDKYDDFLAGMKSLGSDEYISIYTTAYARFMEATKVG